MEQPATTLSVCVRGNAACVKIAGRANFTSSPDFKRLMHQLREDGCESIVLDLTGCVLMDSTFLGVLARIGRESESGNGRPACRVELFNPTERVVELLDNLGVMGLFHVVHQAPDLGRFEPVQSGNASRVELNRTCLEAHQTLMDTSPENERRFKDAAEFFRKNLKENNGEP